MTCLTDKDTSISKKHRILKNFGGDMKDKKNNTSALSIFGAATATSASGSNSKSDSKITTTVAINIDLAGLIAKGEEILQDELLATSSGKVRSFLALGKELLKDSPSLQKEFEQTTNLSGVYKIGNSGNEEMGINENQKLSHKYALRAVQNGIDFLRSLQ
jgi:hypothetical protein